MYSEAVYRIIHEVKINKPLDTEDNFSDNSLLRADLKSLFKMTSCPKDTWYRYNISIDSLFKFVLILSRNPGLVDQEMMEYFSVVLTQNRGNYLLSMTCSKQRENPLEIVRLILQAGGDPNVVDANDDSLLHLLAANSLHSRDVVDSTASLLMDSGAHLQLQRLNKKGMTVADVWHQQHDREASGWTTDLPDWCQKTVLKLTSLSAIVIRRHKVPYSGKLPMCLQNFVEYRY